ncbi:MAG: T9SS type A sorting domain-containing protein, partial [Saprospiraceae bacterium]|nr:T9SS type A sorting domain-containing protein [Saprospiraceae bacterium]
DGNFFKLKLQDSLAEYSGEFLIYENDPCQSACIFSKGFNSSSGSDILFSFKTELGKTYFLKVQSNKNQIFKAVCEPAQANDICSGAIPLVGGITISDFENLSQDKADGCRFLDFPKGQWFEISGKSVLYEIKSNNGFVYTIYEGTDCQNLKCLQVRQLFSGFKLVLNVESNKNYYLILSPIEDNTQFEITEREKETNSICENSKAITCGDTASVNLLRHGPPLNDLFCTSNFPEAWYKIEGKNNAVKLRGFNAEAGNLQYLVRKDCNETCPLNWLPIFSPSDDGNNYFLKEGFEYYLKVAYPENAANTKDPFISVECIDDAYSNVEKQFAIPLTCGSHILDKSRISTSIYNTCFRNNNGTLFYEIPNSGFISIKIDSRIDDASFFIADDNCNFVHSLNQNPGFFIPSTGKYYLVIVANSLRNNIEFSVFLNCITSSKEIGNDDLITVTPNPFTNQLIVKSDALSIGKNVGIRLFDLDGRSIFQNSMSVQSEAELNIPVSQHFKNGMYLLELIIDQKRYYKKVIKVQ